MKRILVIGMLDSVHLARWLSQFKELDVIFTIFPAKKFKNIHEDLIKLIFEEGTSKYILAKPFRRHRTAGYLDFFLTKVFEFFKKNFRLLALTNIVRAENFDFVHAIEIQGAGYLYSDLSSELKAKNKLILTNWGSDIYFFAQDKTHFEKINKILRTADYYSAECERDYQLLKGFDFKGELLPCIPNSGGFSKYELNQELISTKERKLIICKGYGGLFGQIELALPAIEIALHLYKHLSVFFFSVTPDVVNKVKFLQSIYPDRVEFSTVSNPLKRKDLVEKFKHSQIYIGCSKSDAISTSFLEALVFGAYPIQTNTSCANEWKNKGFQCEIVPLDAISIVRSILNLLSNVESLDQSVVSNVELAREILDKDLILMKAKEFYGLS